MILRVDKTITNLTPQNFARELQYVVTCNLSPGLAEALLQLRSARRDVAVVWVDAATFAANGSPAGATAAALRLGGAGVAFARVRHGDDLTRVLSDASIRVAARA